ncbi:MAG: RsmB/NOP family class I SAM-dependent RNA methyltransferase [Pseudomonadota bacterium]
MESAIEIVDTWLVSEHGLDRILTDWGRKNRFAGSGDRRAIADLVYQTVRRMRSSAWVAGTDEAPNGRDLVRGNLIQAVADLNSLFTGMTHAPEILSDAEIGNQRSLDTAPRLVRLDMPDWMETWIAGIDDAEFISLKDRANVDLRVNRIKCDPQKAIQVLSETGISCERISDVPDALRVIDGSHRVNRSDAYRDGLVEIQDAGSQRLATLAELKPGERTLDLCAGGGGKSLAMAAASGGKAEIHAYDISAARLNEIPERANRAGVEITLIDRDALDANAVSYDVVFIDAPCSGSGAWRRNPDAKWRLTAERLEALIQTQRDLLDQARLLTRPQGRIVYGTCSLLKAENRAQIDAFVRRHPSWHICADLTLLPSGGTDGFFGGVLSQVVDSR